MTIVAATDGSALGNPGPSGWAWYIDDQRWDAGGWAHGTNNMGELTAVLELLRATAGSVDDLHIYCDSQYVINTVTKWMKGWKAKGWKKKDGKPPENLQIIQHLDAAMAGRKVQFTWVKGHAGHALNEAADVRAQAAASAYQAGRTPARGPGFAPGVNGAGAPAPLATGAAVLTAPAVEATLVAAATPTHTTPTLLDLDECETSPSEQVLRLERELLTAEARADPARIAELLHPDWREITRSGRLITREDLLLDGLAPTDEAMELLDSLERGPDHLQLVYRTVGPRGSALRSSWWINQHGRWRQVFHQCTPQQ